MGEVDYSSLNKLIGSERWLHCLGSITISEGTISVGDPYIPEFRNLSKKIKPGTYPVVSEALPNNEAVFIRLSEKPAVRWENVHVIDGVEASWYEQKFQGYEVDSGYGCFVNVEDAELLGRVLKENDWLDFSSLIKEAKKFFYADLGDRTFIELSNELLKAERGLRRISGWQETLTAKDPIEAGRQRIGLYREFKSFSEYLEHFKSNNPEKKSEIENLLAEKHVAIENLTRWTEENAFNRQMNSTRSLWLEWDEEVKMMAFDTIKHIVFDNENRSSAFLFRPGDAVYPTFFGYDENDEICIVITDFGGIGFPWNDEEEN